MWWKDWSFSARKRWNIFNDIDNIIDIENYVNTSSSERSKLQEIFDQFDSAEKLQKYILKEYEAYKGILV